MNIELSEEDYQLFLQWKLGLSLYSCFKPVQYKPNQVLSVHYCKMSGWVIDWTDGAGYKLSSMPFFLIDQNCPQLKEKIMEEYEKAKARPNPYGIPRS